MINNNDDNDDDIYMIMIVSYQMFRIHNLNDDFSDTFNSKWNSALIVC